MIYYITIFMFFLCVTTMIIHLEGHLTPQLYLWEMRRRLIKLRGAWYSLICGKESGFTEELHSEGSLTAKE